MNHSTRKTDKDCNVCGHAVEIVCNAASQCSNRHCITRDRDNNLATDATAEEVAKYYKSKDTIERERIDEAIEQHYKDFKNAASYDGASQANGAVKALLEFSSYSGFGDIRMGLMNDG